MKHQTLRNKPMVESVLQPISFRRITIAEALRLSNEIVERAESGRERAAREEAARSFDQRTKSATGGEKLVQELIRLRKQGRLPKLKRP